MYAWRTDDGGRSFSAPVVLVTGGQYFDQSWIAAGAFHLVWNETRTGKMELFAASPARE